METSSQPLPPAVDPRLVAGLIVELNILRRQVTAYPAGHPVIGTAAEKVARLAERLLQEPESVTLGITRDAILLGEHPLDRKNPVYRDFARALAERGVAALTLHRAPAADELRLFSSIIGRKREEIRRAGGMARVLTDAGISGLQVEELNYELFRITYEEQLAAPPGGAENSPAGLREKFVQGLLDGTLDPFGEATERTGAADPALLAGLLTGEPQENADDNGRCEAVAISFVRRLERELASGRDGREYTDKLAALVAQLTPEVRRHLLCSIFTHLDNRPTAAAHTGAAFPPELLLETLEELSTRDAAIPPALLNLCHRLAATGSPSAPPSPAAGDRQLATLLRPEESSRFMPVEYRERLREMAGSGRVAESTLEEAGALREAIAGANQEAKVGAIIREILLAEPDAAGAPAVEERLAELCAYYLETGDFAPLTALCADLPAPGTEPATQLQATLRKIVARAPFTEALVEAPATWGKERYDEIRAIIERVGPPCLDPLLDRLATEQNMSLRRYYIACLAALGTAARDAIIARLGDDRWFYLRNLIIVLRTLDDPAVARPLYRFLGHPHPRVRQETLRTLVQLGDQEGERMLLRELASDNRETLLTAIHLTERSHSPEVRSRLRELVGKGGLGSGEIEVRCAAIRAMAEIGDEAFLPELARQLRSRSLFRAAPLTRLKIEIVRSLGRYRQPAAARLLQEAAGGGGDVAQAARETLRTLQGRQR